MRTFLCQEKFKPNGERKIAHYFHHKNCDGDISTIVSGGWGITTPHKKDCFVSETVWEKVLKPMHIMAVSMTSTTDIRINKVPASW